MADFVIKQGSTAPVFNYTLLNTDLSTSPDVTAHTVKFVMRALTANDVTTNLNATLVTPSTGKVSYTFTATDTATPGLYAAYFNDVTAGQVYPTAGYLTIEVQPNLTTPGGATIVALGDVKDYLNLPAASNAHDGELLRMIAGVTPVVEFITGPVIQHVYTNEMYDGGGAFIALRHRPVLMVNQVQEYRGPILYTLTQVQTPDQGTIYSYQWDTLGRLVRRTVGGGITSFPPGMNQVYVTYTAGFASVPDNVRLGTLELIRVNYQQTQQAPRSQWGGGAGAVDDVPGTQMFGFFVPNRVRELLAPNRRYPSIA